MKYSELMAGSDNAGPRRSSMRSAWIRAGVLAVIALAIVLVVQPGSTRASGGGFDPQFTFETSTSRATAHPDARITIDNSASDENITAMTMSLPDYFWGSLAAVSQKCDPMDVYDFDPVTFAPDPHCPSASQIGTVTASAKIEDPDTGTFVDGVLSGGVYLTDSFTGNDPGGIAVIFQAKVGGVDLGKVYATGNAVPRMGLPSGWPGDAAKQIRGLDTVVDYVPNEVYDAANNRFVSYRVQKMQIDLISDLADASQPGYRPPLLTNPSTCGTYPVGASFTSADTNTSVNRSVNYDVDGCDTVRFSPDAAVTTDPASPTAGAPFGMVTDISFPEADGQPNSYGSLNRMRLTMPRGVGVNLPAFGGADDMCPGGALAPVNVVQPELGAYFIPSQCSLASRPQAQVGVATIHTPLVPDPLTGQVYAVNKTPVPGLVINIKDSTPGNPKGINTAFAAIPDIYDFDSACGSTCGRGIVADFVGLPDVPVTSIEVDLNRPARPAPTPGDPGRTLSGKLMKQADAGDTDCQKNDDFAFDAFAPSSANSYSSVSTTATAGCTSTQKFAPQTGPWGSTTTNASPTWTFQYSGADAALNCGIDLFGTQSFGCPAGTSTNGTTGTITGASLSPGTHKLFAGADVSNVDQGGLVRFTGVRPTPPADDTAPVTTLTAGPGHSGGTGETDDSTPSFTFNADETSSFQCSLDDGAFLPCGSATGSASETHAISADDYLEAGDTVHTFAVRAQDSAGNVDLTPAEAEFKVVKPFAPVMSIDLSTTQSRAHPEMDMTIENPSHTQIRDLYLNMPDGLIGGITSVESLCPIADADAGTCSPGSQIGTVDTVALIDRSTAYITGNVYLTEPRVPGIGEPAGMTIDVEPKLQDITFEPIRINTRLAIRGEGQGLNSATMEIPDTAESTIGEISTFDLRKMVLKLRNNPAAAQPLLTNPSYCGAGTFSASFTPSPAAANASASESVNFSGCQSLGFAPQMAMRFSDHGTGLPPKAFTPRDPVSADLETTMTLDPFGAGVRGTKIVMPKGLTINPAKTPFACPAANYPDNCPASSLIGTVETISPLLPEPLTGNVYMLQGSGLPRLFARLRGRINLNLIANNRFINIGDRTTQIETTFDEIQGTPFSSFHMRIFEFLTTREYACDFAPNEWNAYSQNDAWSGAVATAVIPLQFDCPNVTHSVFDDRVHWKKRGRGGKKSTLSFAVVPQSGRTLKKVRMTLPKGTEFIKQVFSKKRINRYVKVTINGDTKLSRKCFGIRGRRSFTVDFCKRKKKIYEVKISFRKGSIQSRSRQKTLKLKVITVDDRGHKQRVRLAP